MKIRQSLEEARTALEELDDDAMEEFAKQVEELYAEDDRLQVVSLPRLLARVLEYYISQAEELVAEDEETEEDEED
jgi:hypothetical protein